MKRILLICALIFLLAISAHALEVPDLQGYVNDYAGIISPDAKSRMEEKLNALERTRSNQILILTIPTLEDQVLEEFAIKVFKVWKAGAGKLDNGVILIVAQKEGKIQIEAGRGLKGKLTDLIAGRITDAVMAPKFKGGDYDTGMFEGIDATILAMQGEYGTSESRDAGGRSFIMYLSENSALLMVYAVLLMLVVSLISGLVKLFMDDELLGRKKRSKWPLGALTGAVCGPMAGYLIMAKTSPVAWLFYVCSGALLGILGMKVQFSSAGSGSSGSSGGGGGFSGGGGSSGGGGASGDY
ncbi:MAG: hypothetical protein BWK76_17285 [Desulfobulbaceae bacterium A2]|nr:MAG: hypothetical protein BWK76_17285 [Desulfobulbaceae bacterium A2]